MKKTLLIMAVLLGATACGSKSEQKSVEAPVVEKVLTRTVEAKSQTVAMTEIYTSEIEPYKQNAIMPAASGVHIDRILVDVGSEVKKGDLLATLDPTVYNRQLVQLRNLEADYNRLLPVFEAGGISAQQIDQQKTALEIQREVVDNLKRNIEILSPINGVVTARNYDPGDLFAGQPILHVMQINPVKVIVNVAEEFFPYVKEGMSVVLNVDLFPEQRFVGAVELIHPALDATTRTFTVEVKVPNNYTTLRPGMFARAIFEMGKKQGVMIPDVAIQKQVGSSERYAFVIKDGKAERRRLVLGRQIGSMVDILSGINAGEQVAVTGLSRLDNGVEVEVVNE